MLADGDGDHHDGAAAIGARAASRALARSLLLEAVDGLNQASELVEGDESRAVRTCARELNAIADRLVSRAA